MSLCSSKKLGVLSRNTGSIMINGGATRFLFLVVVCVGGGRGDGGTGGLQLLVAVVVVVVVVPLREA